MIQSMTGFACHHTTADWGYINWEIRSINHRYLDLYFHLPEQWRSLEIELRPLIQQVFNRGKFDIYLHSHENFANKSMQLNMDLLQSIANTHQELQAYFPQLAPIDIFQLLKQPGIVKIDTSHTQEVKKLLLSSFMQTLAELTSQREREGSALVQLLKTKFTEILNKISIIQPRREHIIQEQREKFNARIASLGQQFDTHRLEQELLIWAQKSDINEEIERLTTHVQEANKILNSKNKAIGRQLEFLLQEINREANTLASKSTDIILTNAAVEIKVYLEQIREQLQNLA